MPTEEAMAKYSRPRPRRARTARTRPGRAPGTIERVATEGTQARLAVYGADHFSERVVDLSTLTRPDPSAGVAWIDLVDPDGAALKAIGRVFDLHRLALEDAASGRQRPKVEGYPNHLFVVLRAIASDSDQGSDQVAFFVGDGWVVSVQERPFTQFEPVRERLRTGRGYVRARGADYLTYALIDALIDHYFPALDGHAERLEALESDLLGHPTDALVADVMGVRRALARIRRVTMPGREVVEALLRADAMRDETRTFLRDCADHLMSINDSIEQLREQAGHLMEVHLALTSHRMNEVMKVLTIIATIFIPLSFVAGLYGMNFDPSSPWNMPELRWRFGYPFALGLMAVITGGLVFFFWRRGWLSRS